MDHFSPVKRSAEGPGSRQTPRRLLAAACLLLVPMLAACGGGSSHKTTSRQSDPVSASSSSDAASPDSSPSETPSKSPTPLPIAPVSSLPGTPTPMPSVTPMPVPSGPSAADLATMRTSATDRCQTLIANAPAAGPCQYIRTIVATSDSNYVYVEVAASGHDGTVFHRGSGNYAPVLDNGDQPPPCSKVTGAGIPLRIWAEIVHEIEGSSTGATCYS